MKYKALLLDFYGTLVEEGDASIRTILNEVAQRSPICSDVKVIGRDWVEDFLGRCGKAYDEHFKTQREIEVESLTRLLDKYQVGFDPLAVAEVLFQQWQTPAVFPDAAAYLAQNRLPVCIVSNIDTGDILAAMRNANMQFDRIVTSEACRCYKPRPGMFWRALEMLGCTPAEVLHIGDSLSSDVAGAGQLGIDSVWVNRKGRPLPAAGPQPTVVVQSLIDLVI